MKKVVLLMAIFLFTGVTFSIAQEKGSMKPLPIPSFNVLLDGKTAFLENDLGGNTREKRDIHVVVTTTSHNMTTGDARVWLIKGNFEEILGPIPATFGEELVIPVEGNQWGVVILADEKAFADVWIGGAL